MRRREFIKLAGAAAAWPVAARAQQGERTRRIAVLLSADNPEARINHAAFVQSLKQLGWMDGQNLRIETRWADGTASLIRKYASDVLALTPDAVFVSGNDSMGAMLQATRTVPIVFAQVADPVARASSKQWHGRVATRPVLFSSTTA